MGFKVLAATSFSCRGVTGTCNTSGLGFGDSCNKRVWEGRLQGCFRVQSLGCRMNIRRASPKRKPRGTLYIFLSLYIYIETYM